MDQERTQYGTKIKTQTEPGPERNQNQNTTPKDRNRPRPPRPSNPKNRTRIEPERDQDTTRSGTEQGQERTKYETGTDVRSQVQNKTRTLRTGRTQTRPLKKKRTPEQFNQPIDQSLDIGLLLDWTELEPQYRPVIESRPLREVLEPDVNRLNEQLANN